METPPPGWMARIGGTEVYAGRGLGGRGELSFVLPPLPPPPLPPRDWRLDRPRPRCMLFCWNLWELEDISQVPAMFGEYAVCWGAPYRGYEYLRILRS